MRERMVLAAGQLSGAKTVAKDIASDIEPDDRIDDTWRGHTNGKVRVALDGSGRRQDE